MSYESKEGYSYPSHSRLIKETGLSKSTLIKCLKELEELGYIISEKAAGNNNKYFIDSSIKISSSKNNTSTKNDTSSSTKNDTSSSTKNDTGVVLNLVHKNKQENKQKNNNSDLEVIVEAYTDNKELKETIIDFIEMRKSIKKKLTERGLKGILNKLDKIALNDYEKIEILENSIMNCWQGVFEIKKEAHKGAYQSKYNSSICSNSNNNSNMRVHNDF
jgi:DNA-binding Lrp family transcriptional regulator